MSKTNAFLNRTLDQSTFVDYVTKNSKSKRKSECHWYYPGGRYSESYGAFALQQGIVSCRTLSKLTEYNSGIGSGLFTAKEPNQQGMVDLDKEGRVRGIQIEPS